MSKCPTISSVLIRGFRSIKSLQLDFDTGVNLLAGLNDHGKSNVFRALHLFFTGETEADIPLNYDNDICRIGGKAQKKIEIEVSFDSTLVHPKLLESINRKRIDSGEKISVKKTWSREIGGFSLRTEFRAQRFGKSETRVYTDSDYKGVGSEKVIPPRAPIRFREEMERFFCRFRLRYLPSSTTGALFNETGLANEVKHFLFDGYQKSAKFQNLSRSLKDTRDQFEELVREEFGDKLANRLNESFPGVTSASIEVPPDDSMVSTGELHLHRDVNGVPLPACGSGLQSVAILEILRFLDINIVTRAHDLTTVVIWLIEEPEAFLYEDLISAVAETLKSAAADFTVLATTHSRDFANSTAGKLNWVELTDKGTELTAGFNLSDLQKQADFAKHASERFGRGWLELQYQKQVADLKGKHSGLPVIFVEGKSDKSILEKLFQIQPYTEPVEVREAITNSSSNAQHVCKSVVEVSKMIPERRIIGLFDNDFEGVHWYHALCDKIKEEGLTEARAILLPCPERLKTARMGFLDSDGKITSTNKTENLDKKAITIEALLDDKHVEQVLISNNFFEEFWVASKTDKPSKPKITRLTNHGEKQKAKLADKAVSLINKNRLGSLNSLLNLLQNALGKESSPETPANRVRVRRRKRIST